jgi:hypothetical protein
MLVTPALWEDETGELQVQSQLGQHRDLALKIIYLKKKKRNLTQSGINKRGVVVVLVGSYNFKVWL